MPPPLPTVVDECEDDLAGAGDGNAESGGEKGGAAGEKGERRPASSVRRRALTNAVARSGVPGGA